MDRNLFRGTRPVVLSTQSENSSEGRIFVWAWTEWFERIEGTWGNVAFTPVAASEKELHQWLYGQNISELVEINDEYSDTVRQEFLSQVPLFPEAPEFSDESPFSEQDPDEDVEHG